MPGVYKNAVPSSSSSPSKVSVIDFPGKLKYPKDAVRVALSDKV